MVASAAAERAGLGHVARTGFSAIPYVLREACLFGANGSGKSSLIDAMYFMSKFVRTSFRSEAGRGIELHPFLFHSEWRTKPSEFEAIFIHNDTLYQYGFALTRERVVEEWLFARPQATGRERTLFTRSYDVQADSYNWSINSVHLKGERDSWKSQTRPDALFLSTAVQLNANGLKDAYEWLVKHFRTFSMPPEALPSQYTASRFKEDDWKNRVIDFLKRVDIALHDIQVEEESLFDTSDFGGLPEPIQDLVREESPNAKVYSVSFVRQDEKMSLIPLSLNEESTGSKILFELAGPIIDVLERGLTVVIDELNSGLHPLALQYIISIFSNPDRNKNNAQLIFTTHDTSVSERNCIELDQIWLVEKQDNLAARLIPFSDFKTRDARPFQKGYLQGRYGAIPRILG